MRLAGIAIFAMALPAVAHHSHGNYETETIDLVGTVQKTLWVNPHTFIYLDVKDKSGKVTTWGLETNGPVTLTRLGITKDYIGNGDTIKVRCHPLRDGGNACLLGWIQARDGTIKDWDGARTMPVDDGFFDIR